MQTKKTYEEMLLAHWSKKVKYTDFQRVVERERLGYILDVAKKETPKVEEWTRAVACLIAGGFPLTRAEYYLALSCGYILGNADYLTFFKKHWHETEAHRAYGSAKSCNKCTLQKIIEKGSPKGTI